ncbi:MAG: DUF2339 domain-containing protein [Planctomycetota bacterium]
MEELIVLAVLVVFALLASAVVLALVAFLRAGTLRRELDQLRREVGDVRAAAARASAKNAEHPAAAPSADLSARREVSTAREVAANLARAVDPSSVVAAKPTELAKDAPPPVPSTVSAASASEPSAVSAPSSSSAATTETSATTPGPTLATNAPSATAPSTAPALLPPSAPPAPKKRMPIEKLLGVTGAAVLGGIVLAIAGFFLYQYSVQQGWVTKEVRLAMGIAAGALALLGSFPLVKRGYAITGNALAGGGIVVLYAAFWAAHQVFGVWPVGLSFGLMVATTAICAGLALARSSQVVAALGLLGGFATPLALSTGEDHPIGLFGYTLLVNLGFLSVAHKRRWPWTALLALVGTFVIEALWIVAKMRGETFWIALVALGVFTSLFTVFVALQPSAERRRFVVAQAGALVVPFLFALWFAARHDDVVGYHLTPIAVLAALVLAATGWIAARGELSFAPLGAAVGTVAVTLTWVLSRELELERAWELAACCAVLALVLHGAVELAWRKRGVVDEALANSAHVLVLGLGFALFLAAWKGDGIEFAPWCAGGVALALVAARQAAVTGRAWLGWAGAIAPSLALVAWELEHGSTSGPWIADAPLAWALVLAAALHGAWFLRRDDVGRRALAHGAAVALAGGLFAWQHAILSSYEGRLLGAFGGLLAALALTFTARRARSWGWLGVSAVLLSMGQSELLEVHVRQLAPTNVVLAALVLAAGAALHTGALSLAWLDSRMLARVRAASAWLWLPSLVSAFEAWGGAHAKCGAAIALGGLVLIGRARNERADGADDADAGAFAKWISRLRVSPRTPRATAWTWSRATAIAFAACAVATFADLEIMPVAAVLAGAGLAWCAARERYRPLAIVSTAVLLLGAFVLLVTRVGVTKPVLDGVVVNGLAWLFLATGAAAVFATKELRAVEEVPGKLVRALAGSTAIAAVVLVFAWIHLAILNAFETSPSFQWHSQRVPSRDLTLSLAWGLYAFALLILGVSRKSSGLRWTSLVLFLATIAKTFLFDLGHLTGLYRVGSLFGLAITLLAVSLLYQRFVFRRSGDGADGATPS